MGVTFVRWLEPGGRCHLLPADITDGLSRTTRWKTEAEFQVLPGSTAAAPGRDSDTPGCPSSGIRGARPQTRRWEPFIGRAFIKEAGETNTGSRTTGWSQFLYYVYMCILWYNFIDETP